MTLRVQLQHLRDLRWVNSKPGPRSSNTYSLKGGHMETAGQHSNLPQQMDETLNTRDGPELSSVSDQDENVCPSTKFCCCMWCGIWILCLVVSVIIISQYIFICVTLSIADHLFTYLFCLVWAILLLLVQLLLLFSGFLPLMMDEETWWKTLKVAFRFWVCLLVGMWSILLVAYFWDGTVVEQCLSNYMHRNTSRTNTFCITDFMD